MSKSIDSRAAAYKSIAIGLLIAGGAAFILSVVLYWTFLHSLGLSGSSSDWGTFGDFIGGIAGTVIALATLAAVAVTLQLQAKELEETKKQLEDQAETMKRENIEATFFRLLTNRRENVTSLDSENMQGRRVIDLLAGRMTDTAKVMMSKHNGDPNKGAESMQQIIVSQRLILDPLIGSTVQLLRYSLEHKGGSNRLDLLALTRADLSVADQVLLLCIGLTEYGERFQLRDLLRDAQVIHGLQSNEYRVVVPQVFIDAYSEPPTTGA